MIWVVYGQTFRATPQKLVDIAEPRIVNRNALYRKPPLFLWDKLVLVQFWGVLNSVLEVYRMCTVKSLIFGHFRPIFGSFWVSMGSLKAS